jgi:hypothetical protein
LHVGEFVSVCETRIAFQLLVCSIDPEHCTPRDNAADSKRRHPNARPHFAAIRKKARPNSVQKTRHRRQRLNLSRSRSLTLPQALLPSRLQLQEPLAR